MKTRILCESGEISIKGGLFSIGSKRKSIKAKSPSKILIDCFDCGNTNYDNAHDVYLEVVSNRGKFHLRPQNRLGSSVVIELSEGEKISLTTVKINKDEIDRSQNR